jgi:hypothetical protein
MSRRRHARASAARRSRLQPGLRIRVLGLLGVGVVALTGCRPMFRYGPERTGDNPTERTVSVSNVSDLVRRFATPTGGTVESSPALVNGRAYLGVRRRAPWRVVRA